MPFALDEIRKLGRAGHAVYAADTFGTAPGSHSAEVEERFITASPTYDASRFVSQIERIVQEHAIDLLLPGFEEAFHYARHRGALSQLTDVFVSDFDTLVELHDKVRFIELCRRLEVPVPETEVVRSPAELGRTVARMDRFFARPAFSRGGLTLLTNTGPLAGAVELERCNPTDANPWLVQPFVEGEDLCTFSVAHDGKLAAHATYVHPREIDHAGGIVFESVDRPDVLRTVSRIIAATGFTGQLGFDFLDTGEQLFAVECNPRPTAGVVVLEGNQLDLALRDKNPVAPVVAPAGVRRKYSMALIRDMILNWRDAHEDLRHLFSRADDVYADAQDPLPALFQVLSLSHVLTYRRRAGEAGERSDLLAAYFDDIRYDG
jgi:predicted ATP-grasp superfamily ATP-dependent carboligase